MVKGRFWPLTAYRYQQLVGWVEHRDTHAAIGQTPWPACLPDGYRFTPPILRRCTNPITGLRLIGYFSGRSHVEASNRLLGNTALDAPAST